MFRSRPSVTASKDKKKYRRSLTRWLLTESAKKTKN